MLAELKNNTYSNDQDGWAVELSAFQRVTNRQRSFGDDIKTFCESFS